MRTTVTIDDDLLARARALALSSGRTLGDVVDDALRVSFAERSEPAAPSVRLPTFGGSGVRPGVDLDDHDQVADLMDESRAAG